MQNYFIDLAQRPPRSARVRLGGYVILPRMLDKGRATLAGKHGDYKYACPLDQQFLNFAGIDPAKLKDQLAQGKTDGEILQWIEANSTNHPTPEQIGHWSSAQEQRTPNDADTRQFFDELKAECAPKRNDIRTWFDLLDVDDYVSYGGKA
jgi:hypothetical protein